MSKFVYLFDMEEESGHTQNCAPPRFPDQKHTVKERGRGGKMIVSLFMLDGQLMNRHTQKQTTGVRKTVSQSD